MVLSTDTPSASGYPVPVTSTSCRFSHLPVFQNYSSHPTYMPQPQDLSLHTTDYSQQTSHQMCPSRPVEDWFSNMYYPAPALPSSMYHYRYNPYQMYDYSNYHQHFPSTVPQQTSPAASISPVSSIGSISPPERQLPTVTFDWMKPVGKIRTIGNYFFLF